MGGFLPSDPPLRDVPAYSFGAPEKSEEGTLKPPPKSVPRVSTTLNGVMTSTPKRNAVSPLLDLRIFHGSFRQPLAMDFKMWLKNQPGTEKSLRTHIETSGLEMFSPGGPNMSMVDFG